MAGNEGGQCETSCVYYWICVKSATQAGNMSLFVCLGRVQRSIFLMKFREIKLQETGHQIKI